MFPSSAHRPLLLAALLLCSAPALAYQDGWLNGTLRPGGSPGCASCHGSSPAPGVTVSISGPAGVLPGQSALYTITLGGITNAAARGGFGAAVTKVDAGSPQPQFVAVAGEPVGVQDSATQAITRTSLGSLRTASNQEITYQVRLQMPSAATLGTDYTLYATGAAGHSTFGRLVGWNHAPSLAIKAAPPRPDSLTADQAAATTTSIPLAWTGSQGEEFVVRRKLGSAPSSPADGDPVYTGPNTSFTAGGLTVGTRYHFAVFGKAPGHNVYSSESRTTSAATRPNAPSSLTANGVSSSQVDLTWAGSSAAFRVLARTDTYPTSPTDAAARLVYEGNATSVADTGRAAGTQYFYRVWGKVADAAVYSENAQQASASTTAQPVARHVNAATGNNQGGANACTSAATPCRTITHAMAMSGAGDVLAIAPGTYSVALGEVFPIAMKPGTQLVATGEAAQTIIDGSGDPVQLGLLRYDLNSSPAARIEGLTIRNGLKIDAGSLGGAVWIASGNGTVTITRCVFENNEARGTSTDLEAGTFTQFAWGGAVSVFNHNVHLTNNLFRNNRARGGNGFDDAMPGPGAHATGGAVFFAGTGSIINNSFVGNQAIGGNGGVGPGVQGYGGAASAGAINSGGASTPLIDNNLFLANAAVSGAGEPEDPPQAGALLAPAASVRNNLFFGNTEDGAPSQHDDIGTGAVLDDPRLHSASDLRLRMSSPARGAALAATATATDLFGDARPTPRSIGAFEAALVPQTLQFGAAPTLGVGSSATLSASGGGSSAPIVFASTTPGICSVAGSTVNGLAAGTCTVTANRAGDVDHAAAAQIQQSFQVLAQATHGLTVTRAGSGTGTVTSSPAGIQCGASCTANFVAGTVVTLTATPAPGSQFSGWSGSGCNGSGSCVVTMSAARSVTASFAVNTSHVFANGFE